MNIYLIRHGRSEDADFGLSQRKDTHLSEKGKQEVINQVSKFSEIPFSKIYYSPWNRAKETAELLFGAHNKEEIPYIHEYIKPVALEGIKKELVKKFWSDNLENVVRPDWKPGGGESFNDVVMRAKKFISKLKEHADSDVIGVVSHGTFFRHLAGQMLAKENYTPDLFAKLLRHIQLDNIGYIHLKMDKSNGNTKIVHWNSN